MLPDGVSQKQLTQKPLRVCRKCGDGAYIEEDLERFVKSSGKPYGRNTLCKKCFNEYQNNFKFKDGTIRITRYKSGPRMFIRFNGHWKPWSHVVVGMFLGRSIDFNEVVHHENYLTLDDRPENLRVMRRRGHSQLHLLKGERALPETIRRREEKRQYYLRRKDARARRSY